MTTLCKHLDYAECPFDDSLGEVETCLKAERCAFDPNSCAATGKTCEKDCPDNRCIAMEELR